MGAVLHMVNVRLSPEQILYTINHAEDDILLVHADFLPLLEGIKDRIERVRTIVLLSDDNRRPATTLELAGEYEELLATASPDFAFPDFDENTRATTFYTTGTTGLPKGVNFSHRQLVLHTLAVAATFGANPEQGRFHRGDVYMPITPMFHVHAWGFPYIATMFGVKQVYPGRYAPDLLVRLFVQEKVTFSHCVPTLLHMMLTCEAGAKGYRHARLEGRDRRFGTVQGAGNDGARTRHRRVRRLRYVGDVSGHDPGHLPARLAAGELPEERNAARQGRPGHPTGRAADRRSGWQARCPSMANSAGEVVARAHLADADVTSGTRALRPNCGRAVICTLATLARLTNVAGCRSPIAPRT